MIECFQWFQATEDCSTKGMTFEDIKASNQKIDFANHYTMVCEGVIESPFQDERDVKASCKHTPKDIHNLMTTILIKFSDNIHGITSSIGSINTLPTNMRSDSHALEVSDIIHLFETDEYYYLNRSYHQGGEWITLNKFDDIVLTENDEIIHEARAHIKKFYDEGCLDEVSDWVCDGSESDEDVFADFENQFVYEIDDFEYCDEMAYNYQKEFESTEDILINQDDIDKLWHKVIFNVLIKEAEKYLESYHSRYNDADEYAWYYGGKISHYYNEED